MQDTLVLLMQKLPSIQKWRVEASQLNAHFL